MKDLTRALTHQKKISRYRTRKISDSATSVEQIIDGKKVINFCSNDYLGLANHPKLKQQTIKAIKQYGVGSGASHLISGHSTAHHQLEQELAQFCGYERALLFSTGYMANIGLCQTLLSKGDFVFQDRLNHASLIDGGLMSGARLQRYLHKDVNSLQKKLQKVHHIKTEKLVLTDGVFSMDGDIAPLPQLATLCQQSSCRLMVDDAHGFGVLGKTGKGSLQHFGLSRENVPIYMATLGKALGCAGAFIAGSESLIESLIQFARSYVYTTAMPPAMAQAARCSLKIMQDEPEHLSRLQHNIIYFKKACAQNNIKLQASDSAIQPLMMGCELRALNLSKKLLEQGLFVSAIRPPTVATGTSRLRITLSGAHNTTQIDYLVETLNQFIVSE